MSQIFQNKYEKEHFKASKYGNAISKKFVQQSKSHVTDFEPGTKPDAE